MTIGEIIPIQEYDYMIFPHDGKFKVKWGVDGTTVFETTDQTDAFPAFEYCRDQMATNGQTTVIKPFYTPSTFYPMSQALEIDASTRAYQRWKGTAGPWNKGVELRATNNTPIFQLKGGLLSVCIEDMSLAHNQAGYSSSLIRSVDRNVETIFRGLRFNDYGRNVGNAFAYEIDTDGEEIYENIVDTCVIRGFDNAFYFDIPFSDTGSGNFIASLIFDKIFVWNAKKVAKAEGHPQGNLIGINFNNIHFQWSTLNSLGADEGVYDFSDDIKGYMIRLTACQTWDIPVGTHMLKIGPNCEIAAVNSNGCTRVGGSGVDKFRYWDYYTYNSGVYRTSSTLTRDYAINHSLGVIPKKVFCTVMNLDTHTILPHVVPENSLTTSQFKIRLAQSPPLPRVSGEQNLIVAWEVYY